MSICLFKWLRLLNWTWHSSQGTWSEAWTCWWILSALSVLKFLEQLEQSYGRSSVWLAMWICWCSLLLDNLPQWVQLNFGFMWTFMCDLKAALFVIVFPQDMQGAIFSVWKFADDALSLELYSRVWLISSLSELCTNLSIWMPIEDWKVSPTFFVTFTLHLTLTILSQK